LRQLGVCDPAFFESNQAAASVEKASQHIGQLAHPRFIETGRMLRERRHQILGVNFIE